MISKMERPNDITRMAPIDGRGVFLPPPRVLEHWSVRVSRMDHSCSSFRQSEELQRSKLVLEEAAPKLFDFKNGTTSFR